MEIPVESTRDFESPVDDSGNPYYVTIGSEVVGKLLGVKDDKILIEPIGGQVMLVVKAILQGDGIRAEVLVGTAGTRVLIHLEKPSARVAKAIEVIEAEILTRLREELGLPSAAEVVGKPSRPTTATHRELLRTLGWERSAAGEELMDTIQDIPFIYRSPRSDTEGGD